MDNKIASQKAAVTIVIGFGHYSYVALYRLDGSTVIIAAIRHQLEAGLAIRLKI